jgi:hypothetical protein
MNHSSLRSLSGLIFTVLVSLIFQPGYTQQKLEDKLPIDPSVRIGKFSNGLTYYIRKNVRPEKKAELRLVVNVGSILEDDDQQGLAHFIEHMAFNGSKNFKKNDIVSFLQSIGVEFGADLNAYTLLSKIKRSTRNAVWYWKNPAMEKALTTECPRSPIRKFLQAPGTENVFLSDRMIF